MFDIVSEPIDARALEASVRDDRYGGIVTFLGVVRSNADDGRAVSGLSYEAYGSMAVAEFTAIAAEARERFGDVRVRAAHRIGDLSVGDVAVAVVAAAVHRAQAFDACEYVIDEIKRRAPIWKKEHFSGGTGEWKANCGHE